MKRILAVQTPQHVDQEIVVKGFVHVRRDHGKLIFFDLRDASGLLQVVVVPSVSEEAHKMALELRPEDVVEVHGLVKARPEKLVNPKIKSGTVELSAKKIIILSKAETLPFDMGGERLNLELPTLLDYRSLTLRHESVRQIFKVQAAILEGFRKISQELGCVEIVVPTIAASSTEGGAEVFTVDYYGHKAFMTQSPQLYKQMLVPVLERVFTIAHAYRAEPSVTTRHLSETTQMDCEFGFVEFEDLLDLLEKVGVETLKYVEDTCKEIFTNNNLEPIGFGKDLPAGRQVPRLKLREAQEIIFKEFGRDNRQEKDLTPQDEIDLCKWAKEKHGSDLVTITHFPTKKRAFYTMPDPKDPEYSLSYDLLFRGVEILSGSQRVHDYNELVAAIKDRGMDPTNFAMYLQAFKYGMPPEGGFSFGLERITMKLLELSNIREASLFPRDMERVDERFSILAEKTKEIHKKNS
ncbi:aspartate--tRNA(Asn) ligase [Candidatus Roizmanbacteria bacterium]|nr:aspartate--tRNA(Asn) ligase [Candidatus Roizmanbacteria bacterium]